MQFDTRWFICYTTWISSSDAQSLPDHLGERVIGQLTDSLHRVLEVRQVVEAHGDTCSRHRRTVHLQQALHAAALHELGRELLVTQQ